VACAGQSPKSAHQEPNESEEPIYDLGPGITPPRVIRQVNPQHSESSRGVRVNGSVAIAVIITSKGLPKDPSPTTQNPFGNLGRDAFRAPNFNQLDLAVDKNCHLAERFNLQFRSEFFNI